MRNQNGVRLMNDSLINNAIHSKVLDELAATYMKRECYENRREELHSKMGRNDILHKEYLELERELRLTVEQIKQLSIEAEMWEKFRDLCLTVEQEVKKGDINDEETSD